MNILCPTDLTLAADMALNYAGNIAKKANGSVTLFHALAKKEGNADLDKAHRANLAELGKQGVKVDQVQRVGPYMKEIAGEARGKSLMVVGTHGVQGLRQEMLGADILKLVRSVECPSLVVQLYAKRELNLGRIVMPVAAHDDISSLLNAVCLLAKTCGSEVQVYQQLVEGGTTSNAILRNKGHMIDRLKAEKIPHVEVNEPVGNFYDGFAMRTIRHAQKVGAGCIAVMAHGSAEHKKIADREKEELLTNNKGIPVLCA